MPIYTPPALNAVDFALTARTPENVDPYTMALSVYSVPALNAIDFAVATYTPPVYNTVDFELVAALITYYGILKRWTGAIWERALLKVYTGSFEAKPVKRWDGSNWLEIDATG
jgi:hypothetical protein